MTAFEKDRAYLVLVCDLVGLRHDAGGHPDHSEFAKHVRSLGEEFHLGPFDGRRLEPGVIHFFYMPDISTASEVISAADAGYDAVIAAATIIPEQARFSLGGVRIGAGTGNMKSASWGGPGGGGGAPLMNTPGLNSRATAQMVFKALLSVRPDLPLDELHNRVLAGNFDTGRDLRQYPTEKLDGKCLAVLGYGNIGRHVARIGEAFGMRVQVYARKRHQASIEADGYRYAPTPADAARGADVLSVHVGLGPLGADGGGFANAGLVDSDVLAGLSPNAVVINYDRGEIVDIPALAQAIENGGVQHIFVDADIFSDDSDRLTGPLVPYRNLAQLMPGAVHLLPHAAADTDHSSRVAGAKLAADLLRDVIRSRLVDNLVGPAPAGYGVRDRRSSDADAS